MKAKETRHRFGGLMGDMEKLVVDKLGGPTKSLAFLVTFYLKYKYLADEEQAKLNQIARRL